jgi:hypothetical protein
MISIRDADHKAIKQIDSLLSSLGDDVPAPIIQARMLSYSVLLNIQALMQQAPVIEPAIAPMSEADKRICYPERYK